MDLQKEMFEKLTQNSSLIDLQDYFASVFSIRGFNNEKTSDKMLMLIEEVGELAKALRKSEKRIAIDYERIKEYESVESELADVFIVLLSVCINENVNLMEAVLKKEEVNINRLWKI